MAEVAVDAVPAQGQARQTQVQVLGAVVQHFGHGAQAHHIVVWQGRQYGFGGPCGQGARRDGLIQGRNGRIGFAQHVHVGWGQAATVHAPAPVDVHVQRHMDDLRGAGGPLQGLLERATWVDPVEHQHHIGFAHSGAGLWAHEVGGRAHVLRVVGGERGRVFEVGDDAGLQRFGQGHARLPVGHFA